MEVKPKRVMKSKSSNSALVTRPDRKIKKTRANAKQPLDVKKRAGYVENKTTKSLDTHGTDNFHIEKRPPPPARPGRKGFLTSVLSILSKDTTPATIRIPEPKKKKVTVNERRESDTNEDAFETEGVITEKISTTEVEEFRKRIQEKKKKKYRSKILNEYINADKFEVLQCKKKHMSNTSSLGSEFEKEEISWIGFPKLVNDFETEGREVSNLVRQITEGRKSKDKVIDKKPSTVVAEHKDDKNLYNFFVDILETTFSVYNVKTESSNTASATSSNAALEIDETVAKKLRFKNIYNQETNDDFTQKPSKPYYTVTDSKADWLEDVNIRDYVETKPTKRREQQIRSLTQKRRERGSNSPQRKFHNTPQKRRLVSNSYNYSKNRVLPAKTQSDVISQRNSFNKKNKKRNLLNMLREQLKMDDNYYDEPRNLYDALRVMARNKRKYQKSIRFMSNKKAEEMEDECMLKQRKIITPSSSFKYHKPISTRQSEISRIRRKSVNNEESTDDDNLSNHSIEVYGYDYDSPSRKRFITPKLKHYLFTYHSSDSDLEENTYLRTECID